MNILELEKYEFNGNLITRNNGDVLMVYNKTNGDMYEINEVGKTIYDYLKDVTPIPEMLNKLCEEYNATIDDIKDDVEDFLQRMIELEVMYIE